MKVFISWSKEPSKTVAKALSEWLPTIIQVVKPWMSAEDIAAGSRWNSTISSELAVTSFGIICVTPQNQHEPWIQFEAGALAKAIGPTDSSSESFVCPYLIGMPKSSLTGPLTAFQSVEATREDTLQLLKSINNAIEQPLSERVLQNSFDRGWGELEAKLKELPTGESAQQPHRRPEEMLAEILEIVRDTNRKTADISLKSEIYRLASKLNSYNPQESAPPVRVFTVHGVQKNVEEFLQLLQDYDRQVRSLGSVLKNEDPFTVEVQMVGKSALELDNLLGLFKAKALARDVVLEP